MTDRQTGRTTRQLKAAPRNAHYVAPTSSSVHYILDLCWKLQRTDIRVVGPSWLETESYRGLKPSEVVMDHATWGFISQRVEHAFLSWVNRR